MGFLDRTGAVGINQWAYRRKHSCRDLLALLVASWILILESGQKVGLFFSDISGAFDRVSSDLLLQKARAAGVSDQWLSFLKDYLRAWVAHVVVDGCSSDAWTLSNTVFQGTVLGPILWNLFFADIEKVALELGMEEAKFADDFNCFKACIRDVTNRQILENLWDVIVLKKEEASCSIS